VNAPRGCFESIGYIGAYGAEGRQYPLPFGRRQAIDDATHAQNELLDRQAICLSSIMQSLQSRRSYAIYNNAHAPGFRPDLAGGPIQNR
jgi:hypothetical protein